MQYLDLLVIDKSPSALGEFLTRVTIWLALCGYTLSWALRLRDEQKVRFWGAARRAWTLGCAFFVAHVVFAFSFFHGWSHSNAYAATARDTLEKTGLHWGAGLYLNYLFMAAWVADVGWWWINSERFAIRSRKLDQIWAGFFFFMVFNGTVVFGKGPVRWFGALICAALVLLWWRRSIRQRQQMPVTKSP